MALPAHSQVILVAQISPEQGGPEDTPTPAPVYGDAQEGVLHHHGQGQAGGEAGQEQEVASPGVTPVITRG